MTNKPSYAVNGAAMREALEKCADIINKFSLAEIVKTPMEVICDIEGIINASLAAPPRNCDRFADELDAQLAFLNEVWLISIDRETMTEQDAYENWTDEMRARYGRWLLAPATEQKGESDGSK